MLSPCRTWRYLLAREVAPLDGEGTVTFVGLNPSTADEERDDATTRRCKGFARRWGFARMQLVNIYAYRATDPRVLGKVDDPVGPDNFEMIEEVVNVSDKVVVAWGANVPREAAKVVLDLIPEPFCLGVTKNGSPRHPLRLRTDTPLVPFVRSA